MWFQNLAHGFTDSRFFIIIIIVIIIIINIIITLIFRFSLKRERVAEIGYQALPVLKKRSGWDAEREEIGKHVLKPAVHAMPHSEYSNCNVPV